MLDREQQQEATASGSSVFKAGWSSRAPNGVKDQRSKIKDQRSREDVANGGGKLTKVFKCVLGRGLC